MDDMEKFRELERLGNTIDPSIIEAQILEQVHAGLVEAFTLDRRVRWFHFIHLPEPLRAASMPFAEIAMRMVATLPEGAERSACLRHLLEAKDCAVRAAMEGNGTAPFTTVAPR